MRSLACVACFWFCFGLLQSDASQFRFLSLAWVRIDVFLCWLSGASRGDRVLFFGDGGSTGVFCC